MAEDGFDAMILYTNFIRSGAVSFITGFSPYWADGILIVPREGETLFVTTLSKRVAEWIQTVKPLGALTNGPAPGAIAGKHLAAMSGVKRIAVLELDAFPAGLYDDLASALPACEIADGSESFAHVRCRLDEEGRRLLERADAIARDALAAIDADAANVGAAVGEAERQARLRGAEEAYLAIAPDLDKDKRFLRLSGPLPLSPRFAVRATIAYKGAWVKIGRAHV